ncbi:transposase, partial [Streptomyces sp. NPDC004629]|uniref:transposase n=1 Tax=Streptomyces sp. NPDC004629 TaxID=3364705 RepID=UPI0036A9B1B7
LIRTDSGGGTLAFLDWLSKPGRWLSYSVGMTITDATRQAVLNIPKKAWTPAYNDEGTERPDAWVAEITDMPDLSSWPRSMRLIVSKERPHSGAQLRFTDLDGLRLACFATNTKGGRLADLELRHRRRARCEDRIRNARDTGLRNLPLHDTAQNRTWLKSVSLALDLDADARPDRQDPPLGTKKLRLRLFSARRPAREHRTPLLAPLHRPMALDRRHHPRDRHASPRLTSNSGRLNNPHHPTGEVEPGAHDAKTGPSACPSPEKTPLHRHNHLASKLTGTHERSQLKPGADARSAPACTVHADLQRSFR